MHAFSISAMAGSALINICGGAKAFFRGNFVPTRPSSPTDQKRVQFIDLAKGLCILLVVIFHSPRISVDMPGIAAMRMPLYFILSGLFFKTYGGLLMLIEKKINKILIPFLFFITVDILIRLCSDGVFDWKQYLMPITDGQHLHNIPIWFLCALFFSNILFCILVVNLRRTIPIAIGVFAAGAIGATLTHHQISLPLYLTQALNGLPFFFIGYLLRSTSILLPNRLDRFNLPIALLLISIGAGICLIAGFTPRLDFFQNHCDGGWLLFYIVALTMVGGSLMLCKSIGWLPIVSYLGRYSIIVLGLHQLLLFLLRWAQVPLTEHKLMGWSLCSAVLLICWIAIPLLTRLLPFFTAQKDIFSMPTRLPGKLRFLIPHFSFHRR